MIAWLDLVKYIIYTKPLKPRHSSDFIVPRLELTQTLLSYGKRCSSCYWPPQPEPESTQHCSLPFTAFTALHCMPFNELNWTELNCTALHCAALHCTALHCTALHCTARHCHCTALLCTSLHALHCTALHCTALHCTALLCSHWDVFELFSHIMKVHWWDY